VCGWNKEKKQLSGSSQIDDQERKESRNQYQLLHIWRAVKNTI